MKALLRILFILLPFFWSILALAQPGKDRDCLSTCFSTEVIRAEKISETCTSYEWRISWSGECAHALSHFSVAVPCGTISDLSNSENWKQKFGTDPTTGLAGFKIDDIQEFGKTGLAAFTVKFTLCSSSDECALALSCWQPLVAYKAATCVNYDTLTIPCSQPLAAYLEKQDVSCFGANDGVLSVLIEQGTEPFSFQWSNGQGTASVSGLEAGSYSVKVIDATGAELVLEDSIQQPPAISVVGETTNASCSGVNDGSIVIAPSGGEGEFTFLWSTGATTKDISDILPGNYTVTVTDKAGCSAEETFSVGRNTEIIIGVEQTKPGCTSSDGKLDITVSGGEEPYTYMWSTGSESEDIDNLVAGLYDITVTDSWGCSARKFINLTASNPLSLSFQVAKTDCDEPTGAIDLTVTGATADLTYAWSNGETSEDLEGLPSGKYTVTVTDANGCSRTGDALVSERSFMVSGTVDKPSCSGESDGSILLDDPTGGEPPYTYEWSNGSTENELHGIGSGIYTVVVTDANGCTGQASFLVSNPPALTVEAVVTNTDCTRSYAIDLTGSGGSEPYDYRWNDGSNSEDREGLSAGTYTVLITDANGCTMEKTIEVEDAGSVSCLILPPGEAPACGSPGNMLKTDITDADSYSWSVASDDGSWVIESGSTTPEIMYQAGNDSTSAVFTLTVTRNGCERTCTLELQACTSTGDGSGNPPDDSGDEGDPETGGDQPCDECFSTQLSIVSSTNSCVEYEAVVNTNGQCRHELSHWTIAIPCGTVSALWNSEGWKMEEGRDPTTGLSGLKVDDIDGFGKSVASFTVRFRVCYDASCNASAWEPVAAYKAGLCVGYDSLQSPAMESTMTVEVFPNPFRENVTFEWVAEDDDFATVQILDQVGHPVELVFSGSMQKGSTYRVEWSGLGVNTGIYYYKMVTREKTYYGKLFRK